MDNAKKNHPIALGQKLCFSLSKQLNLISVITHQQMKTVNYSVQSYTLIAYTTLYARTYKRTLHHSRVRTRIALDQLD